MTDSPMNHVSSKTRELLECDRPLGGIGSLLAGFCFGFAACLFWLKPYSGFDSIYTYLQILFIGGGIFGLWYAREEHSRFLYRALKRIGEDMEEIRRRESQ